jgi:hypothetical protein
VASRCERDLRAAILCGRVGGYKLALALRCAIIHQL